MIAANLPNSEWSVIEDPLSYLPCSAITEYRKGEVIYDLDRPSPNLYLVIEGCVKLTRMVGSAEVVMNLCQTDDLFGESAFVRGNGERAVALEPTKVMSWPVETVHEIINRHPRFGIALIQMLASRCFDLEERIATLSADSTSRRLAKALIHLAERLGSEAEGTSNRRLAPLSHKLLAQYIGTTREAVTHCMNQFRRQGFVAYTRRDVVVSVEALRQWLDAERNNAPDAETAESAVDGADMALSASA